MPFLAGLNPAQYQAVTLKEGSALVLAGAGSGKTRVLTTRIAWLLNTERARPRDILAVTFTNKAAKEMQTRLEGLIQTAIGASTGRVWVGTFHSIAHRFLRLHWREAGLDAQFQIIDQSEQLSMIRRVIAEVEPHQTDKEDALAPREVQYFINQQKEAGKRAARVYPETSFALRALAVYRHYEKQCQHEKCVDFAELLLRTYEVMSRDEALKAHYQARFRHVLVDEFQDTNALQHAWVQLLAGGGASVFAVGDDDQSIYGFRGAKLDTMHQFSQHFHPVELIRLEQNYRSTQKILEAANAVIAHNHCRLGKTLWTDAQKGLPLEKMAYGNDIEEARGLVQQLQKRPAALALGEVAILYRSNAQSRVIEHALMQANLPYRVYGGFRFFDREEIKHALAYLRVFLNPTDESALFRIINVPARGIGAKTLADWKALASENQTRLWDVVSALKKGRAFQKIRDFKDAMEALQEMYGQASLSTQVEAIIQQSGLLEYYAQQKEGAERVKNIEELIRAADTFEPEEELAASALSTFLSYAALESGTTDQEGLAPEACVQLMTVHAAKGLEFEWVFLTGLEEGLFPHENSHQEESGVEEERRLMYVAMTRAKHRLFLSYCRRRLLHGQWRSSQPSRFLAEIPSSLCRHSTGHFSLY